MLKLEYYTYWLMRLSLSILFIWFGAIKILGECPLNETISRIIEIFTPWIPFSTFIVLMGSAEIALGVLFLITPMLETALIILAFHLCSTFIPLFILPELTWNGFPIPTLEGQFIVKNITLFALGLSLWITHKRQQLHLFTSCL